MGSLGAGAGAGDHGEARGGQIALQAKTALVTGATGGIGEAFARAFAKERCNVVFNGFGEKAAIDTLAGELEASGAKVLYHPADVGKPDEIAAMMSAAQSRFGGIDILVNNAVTRHFAPVEDFPVDKWDLALAVNLSAAFHTIRLALPGMKRRNWGRIINMASIHATNVVRDRIDYITTKHAIVGLTRAVALETAQTGITCNCLSPGLVLTPNAEKHIARKMESEGLSRDAAIKAMLEIRQPSRRLVMPAEVASLGLYLCSDAAANMSGGDIPIDGAWGTA